MRNKNALLLAAVSALALTMATTTANAAYQCSWSDGVKVCGNELGFAPSAGGEADSRDQHSGDHESGSADASGGDTSGGDGSGSEGSEGSEGSDSEGPGKDNNRSGGGDDTNPGGGGNPDGTDNPSSN